MPVDSRPLFDSKDPEVLPLVDVASRQCALAKTMASRCNRRIDKSVQAVRKFMWDE